MHYCYHLVFLVFKGNDVHSGYAPTEDPADHRDWIANNLSCAWNLAGPQNRIGYVNYSGRVPCQRLGSMNFSPPTLFGNFGSSQAYKDKQKNFAQHGCGTLGGQDVYANRMGREIVFNLWNSLQYCNLDLELSLSDLFERLSYKDQSNTSVKLKPLPIEPVREQALIQKMLSLYAWHQQEADLFFIRLSKTSLSSYKEKMAQTKTTLRYPRQQVLPAITEPNEQATNSGSSLETQTVIAEPISQELEIEAIIGQRQISGKVNTRYALL